MLTKITGTLTRVLNEGVRLQVGPLEYEIFVPEFVRRKLQDQVGQELTLHTSHYFEGNPMQGRMAPRLIGFLSEAELEFFELFCTVDKVGVRKAIRALVRPVREIADAIQREDGKTLSTLPGVGPSTADQIIATLRRKVVKFALMASDGEKAARPQTPQAEAAIQAAYEALISIGHSASEARGRLDKVVADGRTYNSPEDILFEIYKQGA